MHQLKSAELWQSRKFNPQVVNKPMAEENTIISQPHGKNNLPDRIDSNHFASLY